MKRFISHEELARDRRFKRARNGNALLQSLPDDVDQIVRIFESIAPKIRERLEGTSLEAVYDDLGPGFQFLTSSGGKQSKGERSPLQLKIQLHGIFVGELQALEAAGRTLWDFPEAPWDFKMNMARQCWDECRHVQIFEKLMDHVGAEIGEFPESTFLFESSCHDDPALRVTGVNRCLEGLACDVFRSLIDYGKTVGDSVIEQAVDFVLADELTHEGLAPYDGFASGIAVGGETGEMVKLTCSNGMVHCIVRDQGLRTRVGADAAYSTFVHVHMGVTVQVIYMRV